MRKYIRSFQLFCLCVAMMLYTLPVSASSSSLTGTIRGIYMSSATAYGKIINEDDVIGRAVVTCLSQVREISVNMYLQRGYGTTWRNVTSAYNMNATDVAELDQSAIIYNVTPGIYRIYIEVTVIGYDGLWDSAEVGTGTFTINT